MIGPGGHRGEWHQRPLNDRCLPMPPTL